MDWYVLQLSFTWISGMVTVRSISCIFYNVRSVSFWNVNGILVSGLLFLCLCGCSTIHRDKDRPEEYGHDAQRPGQ